MGLWVSRPVLSEGEVVRWHRNANRKQGATRAVGGRLFVTDRRIVFQPSRFDQTFGGQVWQDNLEHVREIGVDAVDRLAASQRDYGALRRRLRVVTRRSTELFVVNSVQEVVRTLEALIPQPVASKARNGDVNPETARLGDSTKSLDRHDRMNLIRPALAAAVAVCLVVAVCLETIGHGSVHQVGAYLAVTALLIGLVGQGTRAAHRRRATPKKD
jgi:hypothetical protein